MIYALTIQFAYKRCLNPWSRDYATSFFSQNMHVQTHILDTLQGFGHTIL